MDTSFIIFTIALCEFTVIFKRAVFGPQQLFARIAAAGVLVSLFTLWTVGPQQSPWLFIIATLLFFAIGLMAIGMVFLEIARHLKEAKVAIGRAFGARQDDATTEAAAAISPRQ